MHVHELHMNMHERSSSDELHFSGEGNSFMSIELAIWLKHVSYILFQALSTCPTGKLNPKCRQTVLNVLSPVF